MATLVTVGSGDIRENVILNVNFPQTLPGGDPLRPHVAYEAMHDSGEVDAQGDCHPGTRIAIQEIIKRWADDPRPNILVNLMIGAAGAGKSAIMRTIAKVLEEEGKLLGGFFCFRSSTRRNDGSLVIPTLVAQMIARIPHLRPLVYQAFEDNQGIFTKAMDIQTLKLIIEPLNSIDPAERSQWPYVVLLDGLDEINGVAAQQAIVRVFAYINRHLVSPLHILVACRPEPPILQAFDKFLGKHYNPLELDESLEPDKDIDIFYIDHFQAICDLNPHLPPGWPGAPVRQILVEKGSGKFIFASVVVGVIGDTSSPLSPQERLDLVLEVTKRDDLRPLERLDLLYVTVLCQIPTTDRAQVLRILSLILAAGNTLRDLLPTSRFLDALFCMPSGTTRHRLCNLHSVLKIPADDDDVISPQHATLGDFIFDGARSEQFGFHVDKTQLRHNIFLQIAAALQSNPEKMADALADFLAFFDTQMGGASFFRGLLTFKMAQNLQLYNPSSWSPLALTLFAVPLAQIIEYSWKYWSLRNLSRSIMKEAHRRARLYCDDYGGLGVTFLALFAMHMRFLQAGRVTISEPAAWDAILALWDELNKSAILSMDMTSGLGLAYERVAGASVSPAPYRRFFSRNQWLYSYLHLLARPDIVVGISRLSGTSGLSRRRPSLLVDQWWKSLSFDRSTVSALRTTLLSARPECDDKDFSIFLNRIGHYIDDHWEKRWRIPSLFLLRRDWNRWKEAFDKAKRGWKLEYSLACLETPCVIISTPNSPSVSVSLSPYPDLDPDLDLNPDSHPAH